MIPSLAPLLDRLTAIWPDLVPQWSPNALTIIVRRECPAETMHWKLTWAYEATCRVVAESRDHCVYTSFNANRRVASFSAMYWRDGSEAAARAGGEA